MKNVLNIVSHSETETMMLAEKLVASLRERDILILKGNLGTGKTVFVRGLAKGLGLDESVVNSPSFAIVNEYLGERPLFHFDLYRLEDAEELYEIGWEDYMERDGLLAVEWGDKADPFLPVGYYLIEFTLIDDNQRQINISWV